MRKLNAETLAVEGEEAAVEIAGVEDVVTETPSTAAEVLVADEAAHALRHLEVEIFEIGTSTEALRVAILTCLATGDRHDEMTGEGDHSGVLLRLTPPLDPGLQLQAYLAGVELVCGPTALLDDVVQFHAHHLHTATLARGLAHHYEKTTIAHVGARPPWDEIHPRLLLSGGSIPRREADLRYGDGDCRDRLPLLLLTATPGLDLDHAAAVHSGDRLVIAEVEAATLLEVHDDHVPLDSAN